MLHTQGTGLRPLHHGRNTVTPRVRRSVRALSQAQQAVVVEYTELWRDFEKKAQGEWEGVSVTFDASGKPQPLPERYVPGAFREWGVELTDWQTQCSTTCVLPAAHPAAPAAPPGASRHLFHTMKRLMPTVGCEADAIAFVEETKDVWRHDGGSQVKPVAADGSYAAAPGGMPAHSNKLRVEACFVAPNGGGRIRILVTAMQQWETKRWELRYADVHREQYEGPYKGGHDLSGCAGGHKPFAKEPATSSVQVAGSWRTTSAVAYRHSASGTGLELQQDGSLPARVSSVDPHAAAPAPLLLLPLGLWACCSGGGLEALQVQVGWLHSSHAQDVISCSYEQGVLQQVYLAKEVRAADA